MTDIILANAGYAGLLSAIHSGTFAKGWDTQAMAGMLAVPGTFALLAPDKGMIIIRAVAEQADLITLAVLPPFRRGGLATQLLTRAMAQAGQMGAEALFLEVAEDNSAAIALYEKCGFSEISRRKAYYGGKTDALVMRSALTLSAAPLS